MASRGDINLLEVQPQLYNGWSIISFDNSLGLTGTFTKIKSSECNDDGIYPVIDQGEKYISGYIDDPELIYKGKLPVIIFGDHTRNVKYVDFEFAAGADGTKILSTIKQIDSKFFYFYLKALAIPSLGYSRHYSILKQISVPLPPLAEQKRIAEKLDALFGQLDSVRGAMSRIPTLLAKLRQQILTHAVTGKLTEEWRQGKNLAEWEEKSLSDIAIPKSGYPFNASDFTDYGIQVIRMGNLYNNKLSLDRNPVFLPNDYDENIIKKSAVKKNDILLTLTGTKYKRDYGYAIKIEVDDTVLLLNQRILSLTSLINPNFLLIALRGDQFRDQFFSFETGGVNQGNVGVKNVMTIALDIPPVEEQTEIANRVQSLFEKLDSIEQRYQMLKTKLENLPQAILHKAFKGELVEQLPTDGNATDLLREIEQLKKSLKKK